MPSQQNDVSPSTQPSSTSCSQVPIFRPPLPKFLPLHRIKSRPFNPACRKTLLCTTPPTFLKRFPPKFHRSIVIKCLDA
ncbi:hypothetical protein ACF0H5_019720 [Mactra antiquata]